MQLCLPLQSVSSTSASISASTTTSAFPATSPARLPHVRLSIELSRLMWGHESVRSNARLRADYVVFARA